MRTEKAFHERFPFDRATDVCCPGCKYGNSPAYRNMQLKLQRQEAWLDVLIAKQANDLPALPKAKARYAAAIAKGKR